MSYSVIPEVVEEMLELPDDQQRQVLKYVLALRAASRRGVPGKQLVQFAGLIPSEDLELMRQAIDTECEQVDEDEW